MLAVKRWSQMEACFYSGVRHNAGERSSEGQMRQGVHLLRAQAELQPRCLEGHRFRPVLRTGSGAVPPRSLHVKSCILIEVKDLVAPRIIANKCLRA